MACNVYGACPMTGRDRKQQVMRAKYIKAMFAQKGLNLISPVLEENVPAIKGPLIQESATQLEQYWKRDKEIIAYEAHVVFVDGADEGSVGVGREYAFSRYTLWKPTVLLWNKPRGVTVAQFEDDFVVSDPLDAAILIKELWGTWEKRMWWRFKLLVRTLPVFLYRQIAQFR